MLTDQEVARLRTEEVVRDEIRADLERQRPRSLPRRFVKALNSSLGIWMLSTCVVGLGTWMYAGWQTDREASQRRQARIALLDAQVAARLRSVEHLMGDPRRGLGALHLVAVVQQLSAFTVPASREESGNQQSQADSPKRSWTLPELIWELQGLTPGEAAAELTRAAVIAEDLQLVALNAFQGYMRSSAEWVDQRDPRMAVDLLEVRRSVGELLKVSRWSGIIGGLDPRIELQKRSAQREVEITKYFEERKAERNKELGIRPGRAQKEEGGEEEEERTKR